MTRKEEEMSYEEMLETLDDMSSVQESIELPAEYTPAELKRLLGEFHSADRRTQNNSFPENSHMLKVEDEEQYIESYIANYDFSGPFQPQFITMKGLALLIAKAAAAEFSKAVLKNLFGSSDFDIAKIVDFFLDGVNRIINEAIDRGRRQDAAAYLATAQELIQDYLGSTNDTDLLTQAQTQAILAKKVFDDYEIAGLQSWMIANSVHLMCLSLKREAGIDTTAAIDRVKKDGIRYFKANFPKWETQYRKTRFRSHYVGKMIGWWDQHAAFVDWKRRNGHVYYWQPNSNRPPRVFFKLGWNWINDSGRAFGGFRREIIFRIPFVNSIPSEGEMKKLTKEFSWKVERKNTWIPFQKREFDHIRAMMKSWSNI